MLFKSKKKTLNLYEIPFKFIFKSTKRYVFSKMTSELNISLIPSSKSKPLLDVDNFLYYKRQERRNGDIYWTCKHNRKNAVTTVGLTTEIRSMNIEHFGHGLESVVDLIIMDKIEICNKRVQKEQLTLPKIYLEEMVKALTENMKIKPVLIARSIPKFENKKRYNV